MTTKVVKGSLWTLLGQVAPLGVSLVATPFTIRLLGAEGYGVLILVGLIPTYLGFADLGMGIASTKFGSEAYAAGDAEKEARTVRTAAVLSLLLSVPFGVAIFVLSGWLATLFNVPAHLHAEASLALKVAAVTFVVNFLNQIFNTPQLDRLRMDLNTFVTSGFRMLGIAATPIVIYLGFGILGAVVVLLIASLATLAGHIYVSGRLLPNLFDLSLDRTIIRPMLKFGGALAISVVAGVLLSNVEKAILARSVSVTALAYYSIAFTLVGMTSIFSSSMTQSLVPAFSQMLRPKFHASLSNLFLRALRTNFVLMLPILALLVTVAKPLFTIWAGPDFGENSTVLFYILATGLLFNLMAYIPYSLLLAAGRSDIFARVHWMELIPYFVALLILTERYGPVGTAIVWSVRISIDAVIMSALLKLSIPISFNFWKGRGFCFLLAVGLLFLPIAVTLLANGTGSLPILVCVVSLLAYSTLLLTVLLESEERSWLVKYLKLV